MVNPTSSREVYLVERELPARFLAHIVSAIFFVFFAIFVVVAFGLL